MKKFFLALTILLCVAGKTFAAEFTDEQINFLIRETVSDSAKISAPFDFGMSDFQPKFNMTIEPIYHKYFPKSDDPEEFYEYMLTNYTTLDGERGDVIKNVFNNNRVAIFAVKVAGDYRFKILRCCWTEPTTDDERNFVFAIRTAFVKAIAPAVDVEELFAALAYYNSDIQGDVKFSLTGEENFFVLTAVVK